MKKLILLSTFIGIYLCSNAQIISTIAGNGTAGYSGDGGQATTAELNYPIGLYYNSSGNIYVADFGNSRVRIINSAGIISTIAGTGVGGYNGDGIQATSAEVNQPTSVFVDGSGNIYISDYNNNRIRMINTSGIISTVAGNGSIGYGGDGGPATAATLYYPQGVTVDVLGNIYFSDCGSHIIREVNTSGIINTIAGVPGAGAYNGDGIPATSADLYKPGNAVADGLGNIFISDGYNNRIRKINSAGIISTVAGNGATGYSGDGGQATSAELDNPCRIVLYGGNIYINDGYNLRVRVMNISSGIITTVAGNGTAGYSGDGGQATSAELNIYDNEIAMDASGDLYIADVDNQRIREVTSALSSPCIPNITTGLVAEYNFTGNANDVSGNGNNGTVYGCTLVPDRFGNPNCAYSFDGISDSIVVPNSSSLQFTSDNQSISFWMKIPSIPNPTLDNEGIFDKFNQNLLIDNTGNSAMGFYVVFGQSGNGTMDYSVKNGNTSLWGTATTSNTLLTANQWENIVYVYNNLTDTIYSYLNGVLNYSTQIPVGTSIGQNTQPFLIGKSRWMNNGNPSYLFTGILDDIRIYDVALTPCSVDSLYSMPNTSTSVNKITTENNGITIYPNPNKGIFSVVLQNVRPNTQIGVYNVLGERVYLSYLHSNETEINMSGQAAGVYIYKVFSENGGVISNGKIVIQ